MAAERLVRKLLWWFSTRKWHRGPFCRIKATEGKEAQRCRIIYGWCSIYAWTGWAWGWMGREGKMQGRKGIKTGSSISRLERLFPEMGKVQERVLGEHIYRRPFGFSHVMCVILIGHPCGHSDQASLKSRKQVWIGEICLWFISNRNICPPTPCHQKLIIESGWENFQRPKAGHFNVQKF